MSPLGLAPEQITRSFREALGDQVVSTSSAFGQPGVTVRPEAWVDAVTFAKQSLACDFFSWLSAVDWVPADEAGSDSDEEPTDDESVYREPGGECLQVVCRVASTGENHAVAIKTELDKENARIDTLVGVYGGANWHEREAMEMFGLEVVGHPEPEKLYLPDEFEGHPLRKSFTLASREVKPWPGDVDVEDMPEDAPVIDPDAPGADVAGTGEAS